MPTPFSPIEADARRRSLGGARGRRFAITFLVALAVAAIDQGTKALAIAELSTTERIPLLGAWFGLQLAFNPGTIMSLGSGSTWVLTIVSSLAALALCYAALRVTSTGWAIALGFVWGGAVGNLIDRLAAPPGFGRGYVTDFLAYGNVFIGNLADVALGIGVALGILQLLRSPKVRPSAEVSSTAPPSDDS